METFTPSEEQIKMEPNTGRRVQAIHDHCHWLPTAEADGIGQKPFLDTKMEEF